MKTKNLGSGYHKVELTKAEKVKYYRITREIRDNISSNINSPSLVEEIFTSYSRGKRRRKK